MQPKNTFYSMGNNLFYIASKETRGQLDMPTHFHGNYEIYYLLEGERHYFINDKTYSIKKGDLVLVNSQYLHKTIDVGSPKHKRIILHFDDNFLSSPGNIHIEIVKKVFDKNFVLRLTVYEQDIVEGYLSSMLDEAASQKTGFQMQLQSLLSQLLVFTERVIETSSPMNFDYLSPTHRKVSEIVKFINQNYREHISLDYISDKFFLSRYHLSHIFKSATGFTFVEYLNNVRIKEAQVLLKDDNQKIIDIAQNVGFGNLSHFGRVFKATTGISPQKFRINCKNRINYK